MCCRIMPKSHKCKAAKLITPSEVFERVKTYLLKSLPKKLNIKYIFTFIDDFPTFQFAYACADVNPNTVIKCLSYFPFL